MEISSEYSESQNLCVGKCRGKLGNGEHLSLEAYKYKEYNIYVLIIMQHKEHIKFYPETHFYWHNFSR